MENALKMNNINVEIKNFGKIRDANFKIKPFTIIAGKNSSGKSFITRSLYSIFSSLNKDHLSIDIDSGMFYIRHYLRVLIFSYDSPSVRVNEHVANLQSIVNNLVDNVDLIYHQRTLVSQIIQKDELQGDIKKLKDACHEFLLVIKSVKKYKDLEDYINNILLKTHGLHKLVDKPHESLENGLGIQLEKSLLNNFLVSSLSKLKNRYSDTNDDISFDFGEMIGRVDIKSNSLHFELESKGIDQFQQIDNVVYLESPVYWKIKDVLKSWTYSRSDPRHRRKFKHQQKELKKVPDYILDTFELLDTDIVTNDTDTKLEDLKHKIIKCIGGRVQISDSGDIQFVESLGLDDELHVFDLHHTATGVVSLGVIALLIDKHVIVPNSVLIFDEPEVNLHPAWQQVMIQILYGLSVAGVRVIMASHSFDMMENIEKIMDSHENDQLNVDEHFSIIQLEDGKTINQKSSIFKKLDAVKADLGMPLFNLFSD